MPTYEVIHVVQRNDLWHVWVRLTATTGATTIWHLVFETLPSPTEQEDIGNALAAEWEDQVQRGSNPLNLYLQHVQGPLVSHTQNVFLFLILGVIEFPGVTLAQALNALVAEFPGSPYGDFTAFVTAVSNQFGGLTWAQFKTFVLNHADFFDPDLFERTSG